MKRRTFIKSVGILGTAVAVAPQILIEPVARIAPIPTMPMNRALFASYLEGRKAWEAKRLADIAFYEGTSFDMTQKELDKILEKIFSKE